MLILNELLTLNVELIVSLCRGVVLVFVLPVGDIVALWLGVAFNVVLTTMLIVDVSLSVNVYTADAVVDDEDVSDNVDIGLLLALRLVVYDSVALVLVDMPMDIVDDLV